jgi:two-component system sensor histidine kinase QseC
MSIHFSPIPEKGETEPARILTTLFKDDGDRFFELTVATPSIEKEDLKVWEPIY